MKRIILFDTSIATQNKGDEIIMESVKREMRRVCEDNFVYHFPTHTVAVPFIQQLTFSKAKLARAAEHKFICGTNLFWTDMISLHPLLNVNRLNCGAMKNSVLLGVGYNEEKCKHGFDLYSKSVWKKILSKDYIHSVRDDQTVLYLQELGLKAVNTGCPTLWMLTPEHCAQIPKKKADKVVFTLSKTGGLHRENDQRLIDVLLKNYEEVFFYSQTYGGYETFKSYEKSDRIKVLEPDLEQYKLFLQSNDVDYVGTRLHGGVYAMQQKKRAIILSVDNRAKEFDKYNINCVDQFDIQRLDEKINSDFATNVMIDYDVVYQWMNQFLPKEKKYSIETNAKSI